MEHALQPRTGLLSASLLVLAGAAAAQDQSWEASGTGGDLYGHAVRPAGDVNGDGFDDVVVGASHDVTHGIWAGAAHVLSGADGSALWIFHGETSGGFFGAAVSGAGDVDADGTPDLVIGAPGDYRTGTPPGQAFVYSGLDGHLIHTLPERNPSEQFGVAVSDAGDVDLDGHADVAVGAVRRSMLRGGVTVFSGLTGAVLWETLGEQALDYLGRPLCRAGDVDRDGRDDLLVGSSGGYVRVHSGLDGTILYTSRRGFPGDGYGMAVASLGDLGYDEIPELLVGAPMGEVDGQAYVLDGRRGELLYLLEGELDHEAFGTAVSGAGDLNGDGRRDWLVGAPLGMLDDGRRGSVYAFSGQNGALLYTWRRAQPYELFGAAVAGGLHADGDGFADLVVGSPEYSGPSSGRVALFRGNDLFLTATPAALGTGDTLTLVAGLGTLFRPAAIYLVEIDGTPVFVPVLEGTFDPRGELVFTATVPPGVTSHHSLTFHAFGIHWTGALIDSSDVVVTIH
ncbi:MAG: integrin alpha [Planctomycetota bacterium]